MITARLKTIPWKSLKLPFNLQFREKLVLLIGSMVLVVLLLLWIVIFPMMDRRSRLINELRSQTLALAEIQELAAEYDLLTRNNKRSEVQLKERRPNFTLFSFLEALAGRSGMKQHIVSMKPSTSNLKNSPHTLSMVEMKMDGLSMEQLVSFLHGIETSNQMVWIKGISVTRDEKKDGVIDTVLQVETLQQ